MSIDGICLVSVLELGFPPNPHWVAVLASSFQVGLKGHKISAHC